MSRQLPLPLLLHPKPEISKHHFEPLLFDSTVHDNSLIKYLLKLLQDIQVFLSYLSPLILKTCVSTDELK